MHMYVIHNTRFVLQFQNYRIKHKKKCFGSFVTFPRKNCLVINTPST